MGIRTIDRNATKAPVVQPTIVGESDYQGTTMLCVQPQDGHFKAGINASLAKWARLFSLDVDGDPVLSILARRILEAEGDDAKAAEMAHAIDEFVLEWLMMRHNLGSDVLSRTKAGEDIEAAVMEALTTPAETAAA